ncbi:type II secretion system protein [Pseudomonas sp. CDFA 602]|uniref:type II secretion system protein n=1 Tax=Pseudomonas californiensis TaxID=2829823 RepID=UPI001E5F9089|nr:type II secretion system protein [Pseudomonas californiensis]MCD5996713.1 type II secretion system protein [Pseudomonas californiensis]MCD6002311.1 type II secretion system protein [Pseudomonas californiensis]
MNRSKGFTLVELMITLAVFSFLLTMGVQLTSAWMDSAKQRDAAGLLKQGISRAKATALRNPGAAPEGSSAAVLCLSGQALKLFGATQSGAINCASTTGVLWTAQLPASATLQANGSDLSCIAFNSRGLPSAGGSACATSSVDVTVGNESAFNVLII